MVWMEVFGSLGYFGRSLGRWSGRLVLIKIWIVVVVEV